MFQESANYLKSKVNRSPGIAIILGSGLGELAQKVENPVYINYQEIPHFKTSTAPDHKGRFVFGSFGGKEVVFMQGRLHYYEGYSLQEVTFPIRVLKETGVKTLIATNAAGGINKAFAAGDIMLIEDHINLLGTNPLIGPNIAYYGERFFDMTYAYTPRLQQIAKESAAQIGLPLQKGVYIACTGPSFETPAEIRAFRLWGADAVGMSTVPEVIVAVHCGMEVLGLSLITNAAAGVLGTPLCGQKVIETAQKKGREFEALIERIVEQI